MTTEQHRHQYKLCARFGLAFTLLSTVAHVCERLYKVDYDLSYTFLWIAVLMLAQGALQHQKSLPPTGDQVER
jgi:hypothetical protein